MYFPSAYMHDAQFLLTPCSVWHFALRHDRVLLCSLDAHSLFICLSLQGADGRDGRDGARGNEGAVVRHFLYCISRYKFTVRLCWCATVVIKVTMAHCVPWIAIHATMRIVILLTYYRTLRLYKPARALSQPFSELKTCFDYSYFPSSSVLSCGW